MVGVPFGTSEGLAPAAGAVAVMVAAAMAKDAAAAKAAVLRRGEGDDQVTLRSLPARMAPLAQPSADGVGRRWRFTCRDPAW